MWWRSEWNRVYDDRFVYIYDGLCIYIKDIVAWDEEWVQLVEYHWYIQKYEKCISLLIYDWENLQISSSNVRDEWRCVYTLE